jgi:hypothetical protein
MTSPDEDRWIDARKARQLASLAVAVIAGTMLAAWIAQLEIATRTDTMAPMSPLGFLGAASGTWALPERHRLVVPAGLLAVLTGVAGLLDTLLDGGTTLTAGASRPRSRPPAHRQRPRPPFRSPCG